MVNICELLPNIIAARVTQNGQIGHLIRNGTLSLVPLTVSLYIGLSLSLFLAVLVHLLIPDFWCKVSLEWKMVSFAHF